MRDHQANTGGFAAGGLADIPLTHVIAAFWRARIAIIVAGAAVLIVGAIITLNAPTRYAGEATVLVMMEDSYLTQPLGGGNPQSVFGLEEVVRAEADMMNARVLRGQVLDAVGLETVFPKIAAQMDGAPAARQVELRAAAETALGEDLGVYTSPKSPGISLSFRHVDPDVAAQVTNAHLDAYMAHRRDVLIGSPVDGLADERRNAEVRLQALTGEIDTLLADNNIGDFDGDREAARLQSAALGQDLTSTQTRLREVEAQLAAVTQAMRGVPTVINIFTEDSAGARLQALVIEREELLAGFDAGARQVQEITRRIDRLREAINTGAVPSGLAQRGPNPVHQSLLTQRLQLEAEAAALQVRVAEVEAQIIAVRDRQLTLNRLTPVYGALDRARDALAGTARDLAEREERNRATRALAEQSIDTIRVVERATPPAKGESIKLLMAIAFSALAGLVGLITGLVHWALEARKAQRAAETEEATPGADWSATRTRPMRRRWAPRPAPALVPAASAAPQLVVASDNDAVPAPEDSELPSDGAEPKDEPRYRPAAAE